MMPSRPRWSTPSTTAPSGPVISSAIGTSVEDDGYVESGLPGGAAEGVEDRAAEDENEACAEDAAGDVPAERGCHHEEAVAMEVVREGVARDEGEVAAEGGVGPE